MIVTQFFESPTLKLKTRKDFRRNQELSEEIRMNYSIITLVTREISDIMSVYADRNIISKKDVAYFEKLANGDNDHLFELYQTHGFIKEASDDFVRVVEVFQALAKKSLSKYQAVSDPMLVEILATIYGIAYIQTAIPSVCASIGRIPESNTLRILTEKRAELEALFMQKYKNVSNIKIFDFAMFSNVYSQILKMNRKKFIEFYNSLTQ